MSTAQLGAAGPGVHRQPKGDDKKPADSHPGARADVPAGVPAGTHADVPAYPYADADAALPEIEPFTVPLSLLTAQLPKLQPPSLLGAPQQASIIPIPQLALASGGSSGAGAGGQASPLGGAAIKVGQVTGLPQAGTPSGPIAPLARPSSPASSPPGKAAASAAPDLPSRIGVTDVWKISLGLRFGLPKAKEYIPGTPPQYRVDPSRPAGLGNRRQRSPTTSSS